MKQIKAFRARLLAGLLAGACLAGAAAAAGDRFDYYVMALSWTSAWCAAEGDRRNAPRCEPDQGHGFLLHGLWPQGERDWAADCPARVRDPSRAETAAMADVFGSAGLAWYQWKRHGRCGGLEPERYFADVRAAWETIRRPQVLRRVERPMKLDVDVVEAAFLEANPELDADGVIVTCRRGRVREVRICLTKALEPRPCSESVRGECRGTAEFLPMR